MKLLCHRLFDIRPDEGRRAGLMFAYIFLLIASLMIVKPVRNSLFLSEFGASQLPYAFIVVAVAAAGFVAVYTRLARRFRLSRIIAVTTFVSILSLGAVWILLSVDYRAPWFIYAFYVWVAIFGLITTTQFWLLANYVFNTREAKRLFGFIGTGAIAGGIFGGYLTKFLAPLLHTRGMLHFSAFFLTICLVILYIVWKSGARSTYRDRLRRQARQRESKESDSPLLLLLQSKLVSATAVIVGVGVIAASLVDYQFSAIASETIGDPDELTAFFGFWMSNLSVISLLIQILVTNRALNKFGVGAALLFLPIAVMAGAVVVLLAPTLTTVTGLRVAEGGFKQSINKAGIELLGLPVPARLKNQVKALVDVAVDNLATGIGGVLLILLTAWMGWGVQAVSAVIIVLTAIWIYLAVNVRHEYLNSFRQAIEKRTIDPEDLTHEVRATVHADDLIRLLESRHEKQVIFALGFFETMKDERLADSLRKLIDFPSTEVQRRVLRLASAIPGLDLTMQANLLVTQGDERVRVSAMRYLCSRNERKHELLRFYLTDDSVKVRSAAIICTAREWVEDVNVRKVVELTEFYRGICEAVYDGDQGPRCHSMERTALARAIGIARQPELFDCLERLIEDTDADVRATAASSAGHTRDPRFLERLVDLLRDKRIRRQAREALSEYGEKIGPLLHERLGDPATHFRIRLEIPRVLAMIGTPACVNILAHHLDEPNTALRYEIIRSLNKIRTRDPNLKVKSRPVNEKILAEAKHYYNILLVLHRHRQISGTDGLGGNDRAVTARQLLIRALHEKLDSNLERIFRLLGLRHVPRDMYNAYQGVVSGLPDLRANAVELLDLILEPEIKAAILPLAESSDESALVYRCQQLYGSQVPSESECLTELLRGDDDWLRICALYLIAQLPGNAHGPDVEQLASHQNPIVRETANYAAKRRASAAEPLKDNADDR